MLCAVAALLTACGGGTDGGAAAEPLATASVLAATSKCDNLPPLPTLPAQYLDVRSFCQHGICAKPDDGVDDTEAIQYALDNAGGSFLVFPPGKYLISKSLRVRRSGITLWGPGATIHATNPNDQSLIVEQNNTSIYSFRFTAVTAQRGSTAEQTRIAVYGVWNDNPVVKNTIIRNNQIVNGGDPGTPLANASTAAGILIVAADGFVVAENTVVRTLADGIHLTGGARNGKVVNNTVRETGDDMIAMVSYAYPQDPANSLAAVIAPTFASTMASQQVSNILVANNNVSGQYWGRGISVVGGRDITIRSNTLSNIPYAAAILLARETSSGTYGLNNILVEKNVIRDVQTLSPPYDFGGKFASHARTGHGAVEVQTSMFDDELGVAAMVSGFAVSNIAVKNNTVSSSATPAVRVGAGTGATWNVGSRPASGNGLISALAIDNNLFDHIAGNAPISILTSAANVAECTANSLDNAPFSMQQCLPRTALVPVTGSALVCARD